MKQTIDENGITISDDLEKINMTDRKYELEWHWSRAPGDFVNRTTGESIKIPNDLSPHAQFTGTVREWYETLAEECYSMLYKLSDLYEEDERIYDRGRILVNRDIKTFFECCSVYKTIYPINTSNNIVGTLFDSFEVVLDESLPRNEIICSIDNEKFGKIIVERLNII